MSARIQRFWTKEEFALARQMRAAGCSDAEIARRLDRSENSVYFRLKGEHGFLGDTRSGRPTAEQFAAAESLRDMEDAQDFAARRTGILTAILCGDPPPGRSALDEKRRDA